MNNRQLKVYRNLRRMLSLMSDYKAISQFDDIINEILFSINEYKKDQTKMKGP